MTLRLSFEPEIHRRRRKLLTVEYLENTGTIIQEPPTITVKSGT